MNKEQIREIIALIREVYPVLSLERIVDNIESGVESFGIQIKYSDMSLLDEGSNVSGYVLSQNNRPLIVVNGNDSEVRRRFTIAHELGHVFLHWGWLPGDTLSENIAEISYRNKSDYTEEERIKEREANQFAAEFLAPLDSVKEIVDSEIASDDEIIQRIASKFKISPQSAAIRFGEV